MNSLKTNKRRASKKARVSHQTENSELHLTMRVRHGMCKPRKVLALVACTQVCRAMNFKKLLAMTLLMFCASGSSDDSWYGDDITDAAREHLGVMSRTASARARGVTSQNEFDIAFPPERKYSLPKEYCKANCRRISGQDYCKCIYYEPNKQEGYKKGREEGDKKDRWFQDSTGSKHRYSIDAGEVEFANDGHEEHGEKKMSFYWTPIFWGLKKYVIGPQAIVHLKHLYHSLSGYGPLLKNVVNDIVDENVDDVAELLWSKKWVRSFGKLVQRVRKDIQRIQYIIHNRKIRYDDGEPIDWSDKANACMSKILPEVPFKKAFRRLYAHRFDIAHKAMLDDCKISRMCSLGSTIIEEFGLKEKLDAKLAPATKIINNIEAKIDWADRKALFIMKSLGYMTNYACGNFGWTPITCPNDRKSLKKWIKGLLTTLGEVVQAKISGKIITKLSVNCIGPNTNGRYNVPQKKDSFALAATKTTLRATKKLTYALGGLVWLTAGGLWDGVTMVGEHIGDKLFSQDEAHPSEEVPRLTRRPSLTLEDFETTDIDQENLMLIRCEDMLKSELPEAVRANIEAKITEIRSRRQTERRRLTEEWDSQSQTAAFRRFATSKTSGHNLQ